MTATSDALRWHLRAFAELSLDELYAILALRERVFVVEQACAYQDADGLDPRSHHLWATDGAAIAAYLRIVAAGAKFDEVSIGRVVIAPEQRGRGLGRVLMERGLAAVGPGVPIRIGAQAHLEAFYASLGFVRASADYLEDGIPHLDMVRA